MRFILVIRSPHKLRYSGAYGLFMGIGEKTGQIEGPSPYPKDLTNVLI